MLKKKCIVTFGRKLGDRSDNTTNNPNQLRCTDRIARLKIFKTHTNSLDIPVAPTGRSH